MTVFHTSPFSDREKFPFGDTPFTPELDPNAANLLKPQIPGSPTPAPELPALPDSSNNSLESIEIFSNSPNLSQELTNSSFTPPR